MLCSYVAGAIARRGDVKKGAAGLCSPLSNISTCRSLDEARQPCAVGQFVRACEKPIEMRCDDPSRA